MLGELSSIVLCAFMALPVCDSLEDNHLLQRLAWLADVVSVALESRRLGVFAGSASIDGLLHHVSPYSGWSIVDR